MSKRKIGAVLAIVAAVLMLGGVFTKGWLTFSHEGASLGFGFIGIEVCDGSRCESESWMETKERERGRTMVKAIAYGGYAAVGGTLLLVLMLGLFAAMALRGKAQSIGPILGLIGAMLGLLGAIATMLLMKKYLRDDSLAYGYSAYIYIAGAITAMVGSVMMRMRA